MYEKLCIIYQILVNEIFKGIEAIANDSQKTPPDVIRFQNYNQMNRKYLFLNIIQCDAVLGKLEKTATLGKLESRVFTP